jgi:hypothetical protein
MKISEYRHTDGHRRWELSCEGVILVLLNEDAPVPYNSELLAFSKLKLLWRLSPQTKSDYDYIVNAWIKGGEFYAGSFSGYEHRLDIQTGEVLETRFTK